MPKINNPKFIRGANRTPIVYNRLKPCPDCGGHRIWLCDENMRIVLGNDAPIENPRWQYYCDSCDYQGPFAITKYEAKLAWNKLERKKRNDRETN